MNKIVKKIQEKVTGKDDILEALENLPGSKLNSFLLELFRLKSRDISPAALLRQFRNNRFVRPADTDPIRIRETEVEWLKYARKNNFLPVNLSPLAPLGSCSSIGLVDQNNVVSALRGTEIVSDATNVLALKIAEEFMGVKDKKLVLRYSVAHRHVRGQAFTNPGFSAHFSAFCLASGGFDPGRYGFEISQLDEHIRLLYNLINSKFEENRLFIRFYLKENTESFILELKSRQDLFWSDKEVSFVNDTDNKYYQTIQFKIFLRKNDSEVDLADGGMVDWTQKLVGNNKHRLFISGIGLELFEKM